MQERLNSEKETNISFTDHEILFPFLQDVLSLCKVFHQLLQPNQLIAWWRGIGFI